MINAEKKRLNVLEIIDVAVSAVSALIFAFCLVWAIVSMITGAPSPISGNAYGSIEILQRLGGLGVVLLTVIVRLCGVKLPPYVTIALNAFVVLTVFGGTIIGLYITTNWWDKFNHTMSGVLLGLAGMFFVNLLTRGQDKINALSVFIVVFSFALMCGAVWEIYEYTCDDIFGLNMQKFMNDISGEQYVGHAALKDTMGDVIVDAIGGAVIGLVCAIVSAKNPSFVRNFTVGFVSPKRKKTVAASLSEQAIGQNAPQYDEKTDEQTPTSDEIAQNEAE
ncbi:MAG: hypothetical protein ACI4SC_00505 [Candidatus Neoclostridium sp.]